jgi:hypothetical protein
LFPLPKSGLDGEIIALVPAKLAQLLPERLQPDRDSGSRAIIQVTYAEDFSGLLRVSDHSNSKVHHDHND